MVEGLVLNWEWTALSYPAHYRPWPFACAAAIITHISVGAAQTVNVRNVFDGVQRGYSRQNHSLLCPFEDIFWCVRGLGLGKYYLERLYTFCMCKHKTFLSYSDGVCRWMEKHLAFCILHPWRLFQYILHHAGMFVWMPFIRESGEYCWFLITENNVGMYLQVPGAIVDKSLSFVVKFLLVCWYKEVKYSKFFFKGTMSSSLHAIYHLYNGLLSLLISMSSQSFALTNSALFCIIPFVWRKLRDPPHKRKKIFQIAIRSFIMLSVITLICKITFNITFSHEKDSFFET